ncbi:Kinetochore fta7 protein [Rutstroemia sp. NJR-2017a BVV2]|nr:Kinetochore fta7 protein [Rutstroemia sp. NJR-2017a BVV2]
MDMGNGGERDGGSVEVVGRDGKEKEKGKKTGRGRGRQSLGAGGVDESREVDPPDRNKVLNLAQIEDGNGNGNADIQQRGQKKSRGRPSLSAVDAAGHGDSEAEVEPPKRRGRPSIVDSETEVAVSAPFGGKRKERMGRVVQAEGSGAGEEKAKGQVAEEGEGSNKRGRKVNGATGVKSGDEDTAAVRKERQPRTEVQEDENAQEPKRRGRPSNKENGKPSTEDADKEGRLKKKGRPAKESEATSTAQPAKERSKKQDKRDQEDRDPPAKERRRKLGTEHGENEEEAPAKQSKEEKRKKRHNSDVGESERSESSRAGRRNQEESAEVPVKSKKKGDTQITEDSSQQSSSKSKKRVRISDVSENMESSSSKPKSKKSRPEKDEPTRKRKEADDRQEQQPKTKRQRAEEQQDNRAEIEKPEKPPNYRHLTAVTRRISRETIDTKWEPLPPGCLEKISDLLVDVQRPVILQVRDERKKTQASTAIQMISRRLISRVRKGMPFPKSTRTNREDDFDFEKILDYNLALEAQLTPVVHSNELLEAELRKEQILLENEQKYLADLEANAKDEASKRRQTARKAHPLLQSEESIPREELDSILGPDAQSSPPVTLDTSKYQDLEDIMKSISGHVGSIQGNLEQIEGIGEAMTKTKAAVQATLFRHLDREQYDNVVLG